MKSVHSGRYQELVARLRRARVEAGLTQKQAADALGRQQSFLSKCECGERRVDVIELERFAELYQRPLEYFLPREEDP